MPRQCLLANDLIQYGYGNASDRNFFFDKKVLGCIQRNAICRSLSGEREMTVDLLR
jgi:hypothetical protein